MRRDHFCSHFTEVQRSYMTCPRLPSRRTRTTIQANLTPGPTLNHYFTLSAIPTKMCARFPNSTNTPLFQEGRRDARVSLSPKGERRANSQATAVATGWCVVSLKSFHGFSSRIVRNLLKTAQKLPMVMFPYFEEPSLK